MPVKRQSFSATGPIAFPTSRRPRSMGGAPRFNARHFGPPVLILESHRTKGVASGDPVSTLTETSGNGNTATASGTVLYQIAGQNSYPFALLDKAELAYFTLAS